MWWFFFCNKMVCHDKMLHRYFATMNVTELVRRTWHLKPSKRSKQALRASTKSHTQNDNNNNNCDNGHFCLWINTHTHQKQWCHWRTAHFHFLEKPLAAHTACINISTQCELWCVYSGPLVFLPQRQIEPSVGTETGANIRHGCRHLY